MNNNNTYQTLTLGNETLDLSINTGFSPDFGSILLHKDQLNVLASCRITLKEGAENRITVLGATAHEARLTKIITKALSPMLLPGIQFEISATVISGLGTTSFESMAQHLVNAASIAISRTGIALDYVINASLEKIEGGSTLIVGNNNSTSYVELFMDNNVAISAEKLSAANIEGMTSNENLAKTLKESDLITIAAKDTSKTVKDINSYLNDNKTTLMSELAEKMKTGWRSDSRSAAEIRSPEITLESIPDTHASNQISLGNHQASSVLELGIIDQNMINTAADNSVLIDVYSYDLDSKPEMDQYFDMELVSKTIKSTLPGRSEYPYAISCKSYLTTTDADPTVEVINSSLLGLYQASVPLQNWPIAVSVGSTGEVVAGNFTETVTFSDLTLSELDNLPIIATMIATDDAIMNLSLQSKVPAGISVKTFNDLLQVGVSSSQKTKDCYESVVDGKTFTHPESAPLIVEVPQGHIGRIIGKGGTNIRDIESSTGAKISIERDKFAVIEGTADSKRAVLQQIESETREYHVGEDFKASVREFLPYGAIVELDAGREALLHVSELQDEYVERTEDLLKVGDEVPVTIVETSSDGRIKVSIREKYPEHFAKKSL